jgi:formylglycine-generating enzyme required for sulfatase activity
VDVRGAKRDNGNGSGHGSGSGNGRSRSAPPRRGLAVAARSVGIVMACAVACAVVPRASAASRPIPAESFWRGLPKATERAPSRGVVVARTPREGRVRIPGGKFVMGSSPTDIARALAMCRREILRARCDDLAVQFRAEGLAHDVTISTFEIDRTEVTVEAYGRCVAAGACAPPGFLLGDARFDRPDFPVTHVRWEDARAYCAWASGRLPTEAEWEYAARGPSAREFPWGNVYNPRLTNHGAFAHDETDATDGFVGLAPVGSYPDGATPLGLLDMAGNVSEWVEDVFDVDENGFGYSAAPRVNPRGPSTGGFHVVRGGSYIQGAAWMRSAMRGVLNMPRAASVGFRCAADAL